MQLQPIQQKKSQTQKLIIFKILTKKTPYIWYKIVHCSMRNNFNFANCEKNPTKLGSQLAVNQCFMKNTTKKAIEKIVIQNNEVLRALQNHGGIKSREALALIDEQTIINICEMQTIFESEKRAALESLLVINLN